MIFPERFSKFVCWDETAAQQVIVVEAERPSDATFLATHKAMRLQRRSGSDVRAYTQQEFLEEFLAPQHDFMLVPIVGASGAGKSHLIRWLKTNIPESQTRRVVAIPKYQTTLKSVIAQIIDGLEGQVYEELRTRLNATSDTLSVTDARYLLIGRLEALVGPDGPSQHMKLDRWQRHVQTNIQGFLTEPVVRHHLLQEGGVIDRLVQEALFGQREQDKTAPYEFRSEDLPLNIQNIENANRTVAKFWQQLYDNEDLQRITVDWLNQYVGEALRSLHNLGGDELRTLIREVRQSLLAQGKELVLLIEDFAVLQGIQGQLLDALIEQPIVGGQRVLCNIRTALAVTNAYLDNYDTAQTRAAFNGFQVSLDIAEGAGVTPEDLHELVGGYLNAARLGPERIEQAYHSGVTGNPDWTATAEWVPNFCNECPFQPDCHRAFGADRRGRGLYPFNPPALTRLSGFGTGAAFNPRALLGHTLRYTIDGFTQNIRQGTFPPASYAAAFGRLSLNTDVDSQIQRADPPTAERRKVLLNYWGDVPSTLVNLDPSLHEAFDLPIVLTVLPPPPPPPPGGGDSGPVESGKPQEPDLVKNLISALDRWNSGEELEMRAARSLRNSVFQAIRDRIDWTAERLDPASFMAAGKLLSTDSIQFRNRQGAGMQGGRKQRQGAVVLYIPVAGQADVDAARALQAMVRFQHYGHWRFDRGGEALRTYANALEQWSEAVLAAIHEAEGPVEDTAQALTELLQIGGALTGTPGVLAPALTERMNALFIVPSGVNTEGRGARWRDLTQRYLDQRQGLTEALLARVGALKATGRGRVRVVDVERILPALRGNRTSLMPLRPLPALWDPKDADLKMRLETQLETAVTEEQARLRSSLEDIHKMAGPDTTKEALVAALKSAISRANDAGAFQPRRLYEELPKQVERLRRAPYHATLDQVEQAGSETRQLAAVHAIASVQERALQDTLETLGSAQVFLTSTLERLDQQIEGLRAAGELGALQTAAAQALTDIHDALIVVEGTADDSSTE